MMGERYELFITYPEGLKGKPIWVGGEDSYPDEASARKALNKLRKSSYSWSGCTIEILKITDKEQKKKAGRSHGS